MRAIYMNAWGYQGDAMVLPVRDVEVSVPFYERIFGFTVDGRDDTSDIARVTLWRDDVKIGLAENGGDPEQDGVAFQVDSVEAAHAELKANGLEKLSAINSETREDGSRWRSFFVVAPDGLCFWIGEKVS